MNVALTFVSASTCTGHVVAVVVQAGASPLQPANVEPGSGSAVSQTLLPELNRASQTTPQLIPPALLVTLPLPFPSLSTCSRKPLLAPETKVAVTDRSRFIVTEHVLAVPVQVPLQPAKLEPP